MATEIRVPTLGESVTEATVGQWFKKAGDAVAADEPLVELETDKVTLEVPAPAAGVIDEIAAKDGETVGVGALLGTIKPTAAPPSRRRQARRSRAPTTKPIARRTGAGPSSRGRRRPAAARRGAATPGAVGADGRRGALGRQAHRREATSPPAEIAGTGKDGRMTKGDVLAAIARRRRRPRRRPPPRRLRSRAPPAPPTTRRARSACA